MSTIFIVTKEEVKTDEDGCLIRTPEIWVEVAFRSDRMIWTNYLADMLDHTTRVYPIDNTAQGVYTIGDIYREVGQDDD